MKYTKSIQASLWAIVYTCKSHYWDIQTVCHGRVLQYYQDFGQFSDISENCPLGIGTFLTIFDLFRRFREASYDFSKISEGSLIPRILMVTNAGKLL